MSYLDRIKENNNYIESNKIPLYFDGTRVGQVRDDFLKLLLDSSVFEMKNGILELNSRLQNREDREKALDGFAKEMFSKGITQNYKNEKYPVINKSNNHFLAFIDRSISTLLGTLSFGQHLNGFVNTPDGLKMWIGRRSYTKEYEAGKLDHLVAGGLPFDISPKDNLAKECYEEAGIDKELANRAKSVGLVSYKYEYNLGGKEDIIYCYDLELNENFKPKCTDGEVEEFYLMPIKEVANIVKTTNSFKPNCNLVIIDFLVRHGYITPENEDYIAIVNGLN